MKSLKKLGSILLAVAMLASSISAMACAGDTFIGYDEIPDVNGDYGKIIKCPLTGKVERVAVDGEKGEWKHAFYEAEYPHRGIEQLHIEGVATGKTRYMGENAKVNTKEVNEFWETKVPYFVYNRIYSDFTGVYAPTNTLKAAGETAPVAQDWVKVGFENIVVEDGVAKDYTLMYDAYENKTNIDYVLDDLYKAYVAAIAANPEAFLKGELKAGYSLFDKAVKNVSWLELEGPDYVNGGTKKVVPFASIVDGTNPDWFDNGLVSSNAATKDNAFLNVDWEDAYADVAWVYGGYEFDAPHRMYEYLSINGVVMDGSEIELVGSTVEKEEVVETVKDYVDRVHLVTKAVDLENYSTLTNYDYIVTPVDTEATKTVNETFDFKVSNDPLRETVEKIDVEHNVGAQYEVRLVEVTTEPGKVRLPRIYRYTGGYANPVVEWKTAFAEAAYPYEIFEEKFVDGKETGIYRSTGKYAKDVPSVSYDMSQSRVLTVMLKDTTDASKLEWALEGEGYDFIISGDRVNVIVPAKLYDGHYDRFVEEIDNIVNNVTVNVAE